jgi:energy-coupling factor transport system ATP-binding protein
VALVGPNGAGKTTLAKILSGLLLPQRGQARVRGHDTTGLRPRDLASDVGYVFQNPDHQIFAETTQEELEFGLRNLGLDGAEVRTRVEAALSLFHLDGLAGKPPATLSFPLRRQVALASVYAMRPQVLILDEPTGGLGWDSVGNVKEAVADLRAEGHSIILITHDMSLVAELADRVVVMQAGSIGFDGTPREAFGVADRLRVAGLVPPPIHRLSRTLSAHGLSSLPLTVEGFVEESCNVLSRFDQANGVGPP